MRVLLHLEPLSWRRLIQEATIFPRAVPLPIGYLPGRWLTKRLLGERSMFSEDTGTQKLLYKAVQSSDGI